MDPDIFFNTTMPGAFDAVYHPSGGIAVPTVVFIDRNVQLFPGGYETGVSERRTTITLRSDHAPRVCDGDVVVVGEETFVLSDPVEWDDFSAVAPSK
jgi:hypothetical protein